MVDTNAVTKSALKFKDFRTESVVFDAHLHNNVRVHSHEAVAVTLAL